MNKDCSFPAHNNFKYEKIVYDKPLINYDGNSLQNGQHLKDSADLPVDTASEPKDGCSSHSGEGNEHTSETRSDIYDTSAKTDSVLEMGFCRKDVCLAFKELNKKGLSSPTANQILDIIFDDQDRRLFSKSQNH
ncbi:hypothetical protein CHS0354_034266 [Potamilus streckersoni]|uniref:Uncharacterized protein n=1 Tax=Potamilus streckersoni TaxID=2493646 RepID=A0AAE0VQ57_9BIVA|nr:hypothetical protein CHS0354_034266 [Potamilus streckersoni]